MDKTKIIGEVCDQLAKECSKTLSMPLFLIAQNSRGNVSLLMTNTELSEAHVIEFLKAFLYQLEASKSLIVTAPGAGKIITLQK